MIDFHHVIHYSLIFISQRLHNSDDRFNLLMAQSVKLMSVNEHALTYVKVSSLNFDLHSSKTLKLRV